MDVRQSGNPRPESMDARLTVGETPAKASRPGFFLTVEILRLPLRMTSIC